MKLIRVLPALALGLVLAVQASAQHQHMGAAKVDYDPEPGGGDPNPPSGCAGVQAKIQITGSAISFAPNTMTVDAGQPVCWTWSSTADQHNVRADDGSFTSGPPNTTGTFQKTFTEPGTYGYHCQVHGSPTGGMRGTVTVRDASGEGCAAGKGKLQIDGSSYTVNESGIAAVSVSRVDGGDGPATVRASAKPGTAKPGKDFIPRNNVLLRWADGDCSPKTFDVQTKNDAVAEPDETFSVKLTKATGATLGSPIATTVTIHDDDGCSAAVSAPASLKAAGQSRGEILLTWSDEASTAAAIHVQRRGEGENFRDVGVVSPGTVGFLDSALPPGASFQYRLRVEGTDGLSSYSATAVGATHGSAGECVEGPDVRCLGNGRFEARAKWRSAEGERWRPATRAAVDAAPRSGLFSLAPAGDLQLMLNVVDGCAVNGRFWVYLAAVTDVELTVELRDTQTGRTWVYFNPAGEMALPMRDVEAFDGCP